MDRSPLSLHDMAPSNPIVQRVRTRFNVYLIS
jgi:hypothetical protein